MHTISELAHTGAWSEKGRFVAAFLMVVPSLSWHILVSQNTCNAKPTIEVCSDPCAGDVLGCVEALHGWLEAAAADRVTAATFQAGHPRLDHAAAATQIPAATAE